MPSEIPKAKTVDNDDSESKSEWRKTWYQVAHSDIRWAKEQSWKVSQWTVVLIGAVVAAARQLGTTFPYSFWLIVLGVIEAFALWYVCDLHGFAKIGRDTAEDLLAGHVDVKKWREDLLPKRDRDPYHKWHLRAKIVVIIAAAVTGAVILWRTHYPVALSQPEVFLGV